VIIERRDPVPVGTRTLLRLGAIALAVGAGALVFVSTGLPVAGSYRAMWDAALGSSSGIAQTLVTSTPLILTGLSVALARRMSLWNLGGEGQLLVGATFATAVALSYPDVPRPILILGMLGAGTVGGAAWALGPALLKAGLRINEIITTVVLNFVALLLVGYLVRGPWRDPLALGFPVSEELSGNSVMPALFGTAVHAGFLVAVAAALLLWFVLSFTQWRRVAGVIGASRETGGNPPPSRLSIVLLMMASGALAGVAGMGEVSGVAHRLSTDISANYGYVGIVVAALSRFSPLGILFLALPFGALLVGGFELRNMGTSGWVVAILQGVVVAIVVASELLARFRVTWAGSPQPDAIDSAGKP
jgi:ABC-type uncharacterized transport system permease subunit